MRYLASVFAAICDYSQSMLTMPKLFRRSFAMPALNFAPRRERLNTTPQKPSKRLLSARLTEEQQETLRQQAAARGITKDELLTRLLANIVEDELFLAILDDGQ
jgi:hypothetical protein